MSKSVRTDKKEEEEKRKVFMEQQKQAEIKRSKKTKFHLIFPPESEERHQEYLSMLLPVPTSGRFASFFSFYSSILVCLRQFFLLFFSFFIFFLCCRYCCLTSAKRVNTKTAS